MKVFVVHHNPNNGRYRYDADPNDAIASAAALVATGESGWVAGNCHRMIRVGDLLLFKFGGRALEHAPGIYAAATVSQAPLLSRRGIWMLRYQPERRLTQRLMRTPIVARALARVVPRSFGASIQLVQGAGLAALKTVLGRRVTAVEPLSHGLLVLQEPLDRILAGTKTWEIRGSATARRGPIALIQSKSGAIVGTCEVIDVVGPLSLAELRRNARRAGFRAGSLPYRKTYAWVVRNARKLRQPVPYRHPSGAVIWVRLRPAELKQLNRCARTTRR